MTPRIKLKARNMADIAALAQSVRGDRPIRGALAALAILASALLLAPVIVALGALAGLAVTAAALVYFIATALYFLLVLALADG